MKTSNKLRQCAICGVGRLHSKETSIVASYKDVTGKLRSFHSECDACFSEQADESEALQNKRQLIRFKKTVDRIPLGEEVLNLRRSLGLTQLQAGNLFGGGPVAFSKYENDDLVPDESMSNLLFLVIRCPELAHLIAERKDCSTFGGASGVESFVGPGDERHNWKPDSSSRVASKSIGSFVAVERRRESSAEIQDNFESNVFFASASGEGQWVMQ